MKNEDKRYIRVGFGTSPLIIQGGLAIAAVVIVVWIVFSKMFPS